MTISYTHLSHTAGWLGGLTRLLFIWKGSLFKQICPDFCLYFGLYALLSLFYRVILVNYEDNKIQYELFCVYCEKFSKTIPISFLLGFYVTQVVARWWAQFMSLPWPDTLARYLAVYLPGTDEVSRKYRRTVVRWVNLANVMALRLVSYKVMVRFPTYEHMVASGLATPREMLQLNKLNELVQNRHQISWYPNMWAQNLLRKARKEGLIQNDWFAHVLIKEVDNMANMNGMLICYGWINIPLVYTQVVTLAVYAYFVACLFGRQYLLPTQYKVEENSYVPVAQFPTIANWTGTRVPGVDNVIGYDNDVADFYVPIFTILEFLFYMGWLKVAETLLNPFGEDDDDFDTYYLIDRNLQIAYIMVDEAGAQIDPEEDPFADSSAPELKYTTESAKHMDDERVHMPTDDVKLTKEQASIASVRGSQTTLNIGSKLNIAGDYLAAPVNELYKKGSKSDSNGQGGSLTTRSFNMASDLLNEEVGTSRRQSFSRNKLEPVQEIVIPEESNGVTTPPTPGTSKNEFQLFAVPQEELKKKPSWDSPNLKGSGGPPIPSRQITGGLMSDGELEGIDGQSDMDSVFDGEGW